MMKLKFKKKRMRTSLTLKQILSKDILIRRTGLESFRQKYR